MNRDVSRFQRRFHVEQVVDHEGRIVQDGDTDVGLWALSKALWEYFLDSRTDVVRVVEPPPLAPGDIEKYGVRVLWEDTDVPARVFPRGPLAEAKAEEIK